MSRWSSMVMCPRMSVRRLSMILRMAVVRHVRGTLKESGADGRAKLNRNLPTQVCSWPCVQSRSVGRRKFSRQQPRMKKNSRADLSLRQGYLSRRSWRYLSFGRGADLYRRLIYWATTPFIDLMSYSPLHFMRIASPFLSLSAQHWHV